MGGTETVTILELAARIQEQMGISMPLRANFLPYEALPGKYQDVRQRVPDVTKARELLGFEAQRLARRRPGPLPRMAPGDACRGRGGDERLIPRRAVPVWTARLEYLRDRFRTPQTNGGCRRVEPGRDRWEGRPSGAARSRTAVEDTLSRSIRTRYLPAVRGRLTAAAAGVLVATLLGPAMASAAANRPPECGSDEPPLRIRQDKTATAQMPCFDPDGDPLTLRVVPAAPPHHGTVGSAYDGAGLQLLYDPTDGFRGFDSFRAVAVDDENAASLPFDYDIVITRNHAPECDLDTVHTAPGVGLPFIAVNCTDADLQDRPPTVTLDPAAPPAGGTVNNLGFGFVSYAPHPGFDGADSFGVIASDGDLVTRSSQRVHVAGGAFCSPEPRAIVRPGGTRLFTPDCTDADGAVAATLAAGPAKGTLTSGFSYTAGASASGDDAFSFKAANSTVAVQLITIDPGANRLPACDESIPPQVVYAGHARAVSPQCTDADGDPLVLEPTGQPAHGTLAVVGGVLRYTADVGFAGLDMVSFRVGDGRGDPQGPFDHVVEVRPPEVPHCSARAPLALRPGGSRTFSPDCSAPQGGSLSYVVIEQAAKGTATPTATGGQITYTAQPGASGDDYFRYTAVNEYGASAPVTIGVSIRPENNAVPVCVPASKSVSFKVAQAAADTLLPLAARCSDEDGDPLNFTVLGRAAGTISPTGPASELRYTAPPGPLGPDGFSFIATDGHGGTSAETDFEIEVVSATTPMCTPQPPLQVPAGSSDSVELQCADPNLASVSYFIDAQPAKGTVTLDGASVEYSANAGALGADSFGYHAVGPGGASHSYTQEIEITSANRPPSVSIVTAPLEGCRGEELVFTAAATDPDGDGTIAAVEWDVDDDGFDDGTGNELHHTFQELGRKFVRVRATDAHGLEDVEEVSVGILNRAPTVTITSGPDKGFRNQDLTYTAAAADADPGAAAPTLAWDLDDDGQFDDIAGPSATIAFAALGQHPVAVRATDADLGTAEAAKTITIENKLPTASIDGAATAFRGEAVDADGDRWRRGRHGRRRASGTSTATGIVDGTGTTASPSFPTLGAKQVRLRVTDNDGASTTATKTITIENKLPTAGITGPAGGAMRGAGRR